MGAAKTSETHAQFLEIKHRNAAAIATTTDVQYALIDLHWRWGALSTADRMSEMRMAHRERLVAWESGQQRGCMQCKEVIEDEVSRSGVYCHNGCFEQDQ